MTEFPRPILERGGRTLQRSEAHRQTTALRRFIPFQKVAVDMKWSWRIGRIAGIDLRMHATFLLLLAWQALAYYRHGGSAEAATRGVLFTLALFASVVLHEFGHALTARHYGVGTRDITLLPIGGIARLERIPEEPKQELLIAIAGPAVTAAIVVLLYALLRVWSIPVALPSETIAHMTRGSFAAQLMWVNVSLLCFNLLPAFPMDGGRVLRAALAFRMSFARATEIAARVGRAFALLFALVGLVFNPFLVLIALVVWLGAVSESSAIQLHASLSGVDVERVMVREFRTLTPDATLDTAIRLALTGFQQDFPVVENGQVVGMLTQAGLLSGLSRGGRDALVRHCMETHFCVADPEEPAERAIQRLSDYHCHALPVLNAGRLRGLFTLDNVSEYIQFTAAAGKSAAATVQ